MLVMAKRYYTTELFDDAWFMDLPSKYKLFWIYLLTKCNHSGIWQVNWKLAQFYCGDNLEPTEVQRMLKDRIIPLENNKYWFIPKFIEFQYGTKLNPDSSIHKGVIENIKKYNLFEFLNKIEVSERITKGLGNPLERIKDKDKDIYKDIVKDISSKFKKPTLQEIKDYAISINFNLQPDKFFDFYEAKGWMIGKNKMKDWKAAVRTWRAKDYGDNQVTKKNIGVNKVDVS